MSTGAFARAMKIAATMALAAGIVFVLPNAARGGELDTDPAVLAALSWLATVDAGHYAQSWEDAAESTRTAIPRQQWEDGLRKTRGTRGEVGSRKVKRANFQKDSFDDAQGFVEIEFETRFGNRPPSLEVVRALPARDGTWKVAGYTIK